MNFIKDFFKELISMIKPYYKCIRFLIVFILFFTYFIFEQIPIYIFNIDVQNMSNNTDNLLSLFSISMALIIVCLLYFKELKNAFINLRKTKKSKLGIKLDHAFRYWIIGLIIMFISNFLISKLGIAAAQNDVEVTNNLFAAPLIYAPITFILKPLLEELTFRLSFKDVFKNKWIFILLSGIIFGSIHVIFSLNNIYQLLYLIPYCSLGIAFAYIYYDSNNIYFPISFHILHNFLALILTLLSTGA